MSYDLEVATHREPAPDFVAKALRDESGVETEGELAGEAGNVLVLRRRRGDPVPILTVDGPFRVEPTDLADALVETVVAPRWLIQLSIPAGRTKSDEKLAMRLARRLAEAGGGAVYDPQEDSVAWPRRRRQYRPATPEERIRLVSVEWFVPPSRAQALPEKWLELAGRDLKEALPRRYGTFEPLHHRVDENGLEAFGAFWREQAASPYGGDFCWTATAPCSGGSALFPDPREPGGRWAPAAARYIGLTADFDGRALEGDEQWREAVVALFVEVAAAVRAFYAAGHVKRDVIAKRGQLWHDQETESIHISRRWWEGLPPHPTWLAWFGDPYRGLVESAVRDHVTEDRPEGLFLRLGEAPMDRDELKTLYPRLPDELTWKPKPPGKWKFDPSLPPEREEDPAEVIPAIE